MTKHSKSPTAAYKASGGFETSTGTLYVSKPYRSKASKKLRALITFAPRKSTFDITNDRSSSNEFRTYVRSIETNGHALNLHFATMFSQDAVTLALSDAVLVLSTGICVPFAKALKRGWIRYYWTGVILQHLLQTTILFTAIYWTFNRDWPWVQSGYLTLHSLVMIMKMHSYITVNGQLHSVSEQANDLLASMRTATKAVGGWEEAMAVAQAKQRELEAPQNSSSSQLSTPPNGNSSTSESTPNGTPDVPEGMSTSYVDVKTANALRKRLAAVAAQSQSAPQDSDVGVRTVHNLNKDSSPLKDASINGTSTFIVEADDLPEGLHPHPLVYHPDPQISDMAKDYSELQSELLSSGPTYVRWPDNITWKNFAVYQLIPTLVYELEYPRTDRIRPLYVFEKTVATFGTFALLYTVTESFILPYTPRADQSFLRSLLDLALPFMIAYILLFFIIFECICNGFAELSYFADRQFYEDWSVLTLHRWNSTSWDEFSRKWNKPVHTFLLRHVYAATIMSYRFSRSTAMFVTFLLSACAHELVMVVVTRKVRMYLFTLQLIQIPLIVIGRTPAIKRNKLMGNVVFWLGLYAGFPLLCVAYVAY
ncbi:putative sterol O-acyltransferase 1 [Psilocybe cubensis]|uniref:Sterol O-acyltransferase 1 n=1 Tax=Psilocybe cubensis TaxID=181762 RepID=A0ACB8GV85_PSICU|nr:putative sterol O-acyltransferase 1 [Psilocybe cubensis]KAH9479357.1 putative sterol O-acyltransferase 1 [Psilocybe cubensis]